MLLKLIALGAVLYFVLKYWRPAQITQEKKRKDEYIQKDNIEIRRTPKEERGDFIDYEEVD